MATPFSDKIRIRLKAYDYRVLDQSTTEIVGRKVGMTQVFLTDGTVVPATVIKAGPCVVVQAKSVQADGYEAVQLGLVDEKVAKADKPTVGHFKKAGAPPTRVRRELKVK